MFGWDDFKEDEKRGVKNKRENWLDRYLVWKGKEREKW